MLIPVCRLKDKAVFWIALILLLQPFEWERMLYAALDPGYMIDGDKFMPYTLLVKETTSHGTFFEVLRSNIWNGQLYSNIWQVVNGRLFALYSQSNYSLVVIG